MMSASSALSGTVYIPDTSALIENPDALDRLLTGGNIVVLLHQVIEELGKLQASRSKSDGVRHAARLVTRKMLEYRRSQLIHHGIDALLKHEADTNSFSMTPTGGVLAWQPETAVEVPYTFENGDNVILAGATHISELAGNNGQPGFEVVVISEDSNLLLKCDAVNLKAENLRYGKVSLESVNQIYRGVTQIQISEEQLQQFSSSGPPGERFLSMESVFGNDTDSLAWNTGVELICDELVLLTRANPDERRLEDLRFAQYWDRKRLEYRPRPILGFQPRDPEQILAMEFLLDPDVQLVVLDGPAGSGKTRLMVASALYMLLGQPPTSMRMARQSQPLHPDYGYDNGLLLLRPEHASSQYELGYLPGDYESKLSPWLEPFFQAIRSLSIANDHDFMDDLHATDRLSMLSTSMLRGLDIERSIVLVDELQNGDRHLAKTLMSRFCASSKVALAGCLDPIQIDNPYVDWRSNALTRIKETYRGFGPQVAQVRLEHNYRGPISTKSDEL
jgi:PhoH-like ATPase